LLDESVVSAFESIVFVIESAVSALESIVSTLNCFAFAGKKHCIFYTLYINKGEKNL